MLRPFDQEIPFYYLKPGQMFIAEEPTLVSTLLGSCVSVVMFSRRLSVGAICHGLLPACKGNDNCDCGDRFRYVECSIKNMLREFNRRGIVKNEIEVKLFGGSEMFNTKKAPRRSLTVGTQNVETALNTLEAEGMRVSTSDLGGGRGRKIFFNTKTGEVLLKRLQISEIDKEQSATSRGILPGMPI